MPSLTISILADAARAKRELNDTGNAVDDLGSRAGGMGAAIGAGVAVGVAALVKLGTDAFNAAEESAKIGRETVRVISTTGAAAWTSADAVGALAGAISDKTGADDEAVQSGANLLLTFTNVKNAVGDGNDVFDQATGLALDMATALGTDMSGASIQLGKALNDPVKGITALSKAGVSFTAEQKDQIRTMTDAGDVLGAQKIVLGELSKEFGGAAEAAGTPLDKLKVQIGNLQEEAGAHLIPIVAAAATWIGDNLPAALDKASGFLSEHEEQVKFLGTVGLVALAGAYTPVIAAQAELVATGVIGWVTSLTGYLGALGGLFVETAAAEGLLSAATQTLSLTVLPVAAGVVALAAVIYGFANAGKEGEKAADAFISSLQVQGSDLGSIREGIDATGKKMAELGTRGSTAGDRLAGIADVVIPWHDVTNSVEDARGEYEKFKAQNADWQQTLATSNATLDATTQKLGASSGAAGTMTLTGEALRAKLEEIAEARKIDLTKPGAEQELMGIYNASSFVKTSTLNMSEAQTKFNDAAATAKDKVDAYKTSLDALVGVHISAAAAETNYSQNVLTTAKTLGENAVAAAGLTDVTQASSLAQTVAINANNKAIQDNVKQALDLANATYQETGSIDTASASLAANRQHLIDTMVQHGYSEEAARLYIDRLGLTPANINTQVNLDANQAKGDLQFIDGKYQVVRNGVTGSVNVDISPAVQNLERLGLKLTDLEKRVIAIDMTDEDRRLAARAGGGPVYGGSAYIVGENGPEIFLPGRSGYIVPNRATAGVSAAAATGDTYNVTVVSTGLGADSPQIQRDVVAALRGYEKRNGPVTVGAG
jgi:hypothetical protein